MKRFLNADLKMWHLLLVVVLALVIGNGGTTAAFPAGSFKMYAANSAANQVVDAADGRVAVLKVPFTVPAGQKADIATFFNAAGYKYTEGYCYVTFHLDAIGNPALNPGEVWVADGYVFSDKYPTFTAQANKANVGPGAHNVIVALRATGGDCWLESRSITLIANQHS